MIQITDKHWAVEVPDKVAQITIDPIGPILRYWSHEGVDYGIDFPPGTWQFLFTTNGVTEGQAAKVVQLISSGRISGRPQYRRYDRNPIKDMPAKCWTRDSRHSMETLLMSKNLDPKKNWAVIIRNEDAY